MIRFLPRSLGAQLILLLLGALTLSHLLGFVLFSDERRQAMRSVHHMELLERTAATVRVLEATPPGMHEDILRHVGSRRLRYWVTPESALAAGNGEDVARWLAAMLQDMLPEGRTAPVRVLISAEDWPSGFPGQSDSGHHQRMMGHEMEGDDGEANDEFGIGSGEGRRSELRMGLTLSIPLAGGQWLNVATRFPAPPVGWAWPTLLSMPLAALAIMLVAALTVRRITRPLRALSIAAEKLGRGEAGAALPESGPIELRRTTAAFNAMQERLTRFVRDRTGMLAAISHDLRTPLTSLRLHAELVENEETRSKLLDVLEEIQRMTEATLAFAREEATSEETRMVDLSALTESLCDDLAELGMAVEFTGEGKVPLSCRPVSLKRALRNLIENAVAYGQRARVALAESAGELCIVIDDDGPGIAQDDMERVFGPFVRLEESRSSETGGIGLGMAIARSVIRAHGGDIALGNREGGGLRVTVRLPKGAA